MALLSPAAAAPWASDRVVGDPYALVAVRDALADALGTGGWSADDAFRVLVGANEAMANALDHGSVPAGVIATRFRVDATRATLVIRDLGTADKPPDHPPSVLDVDCEHGRGLILMDALADRMRVRCRAAGTLVALEFLAKGTSGEIGAHR